MFHIELWYKIQFTGALPITDHGEAMMSQLLTIEKQDPSIKDPAVSVDSWENTITVDLDIKTFDEVKALELGKAAVFIALARLRQDNIIYQLERLSITRY